MADRWILPWLAATGTRVEAPVLEFGCGMGRLVRAVNSVYSSVAGVDVSPTMVAHACRYVPQATFEAVSSNGGLPFETASFERIYSYAVFQHIDRWSVIRRSLSELSRLLAPGGYFRLQFDMAFGPKLFERRRLQRRAYTFERHSLIYGWGRRFGLPIPGLKMLRHNHWQGCRPGYRQLVRTLHGFGLETDGIECFPGLPHLVWYLGHKPGASP